MLRVGDTIQLSASDLVGHLNCRNLTELDLAVAKGELAKPKVWSPLLDVLRERGIRHEQGYVDHLRAKGLDIATIDGVGLDAEAVTATAEAMRLGRAVIVQGAFLRDELGWPPRCPVASGYAERPRQLVLRSRRHQALERNQGRDGPAAQPLQRFGRQDSRADTRNDRT